MRYYRTMEQKWVWKESLDFIWSHLLPKAGPASEPCCPGLILLGFAKIFLALGIPGFDTAHQMWPHHCWMEGKKITFLYLVSASSLSLSFPWYFHFHATPPPGNKSVTCAALLRTRKGQELALELTLQNLMLEFTWECIQAVFSRCPHEIMRCWLQKSSLYLLFTLQSDRSLKLGAGITKAQTQDLTSPSFKLNPPFKAKHWAQHMVTVCKEVVHCSAEGC